jgi:hypothetical protein
MPIFRGPTYKYKPGREYDLWFVSYPLGKNSCQEVTELGQP